MRPFYKAIIVGALTAILKYYLWDVGYTFWDLSLISISGLIAGIFFILAVMFRSALFDYKESDKAICSIRGKICSMNDIVVNARIISKKKFDHAKISKYLIKVLQTIKKYLEEKTSFNNLQDAISNITLEAKDLDKVIPANKVSRFQQYQDHMRGYISYLEYGMSLKFAKVGYIFLYFFIIAVLALQIFANTENILLEIVFIFSLTSVLIFFAELIRDLDRPFNRSGAAFAVDLSPLDLGVKSIKRTMKETPKSK